MWSRANSDWSRYQDTLDIFLQQWWIFFLQQWWIFFSWFSKMYLLAASGFAVSVCRGVERGLRKVIEDKFVNCPRHRSLVMRKHGTAERFVIKGSLGAERQRKSHYTTAAALWKGWNEIKIVLSSQLHFTAWGAVFIAPSDTGNWDWVQSNSSDSTRFYNGRPYRVCIKS